MIVVDTNVIAYLHVEGPRTSDAEQAQRHDPVWAAPRLWRSEFRNVMAQYLRHDILSLDEVRLLAEAAEDVLRGREFEVVASRVFDFVARSRCSAYDCEFVALADELGVPLVTIGPARAQ